MSILNKFTKIAAGVMVCMSFSLFNAQAQNAPKLTDPEIASVAVTANQIDIDYGKLATKQSKNQEVLKFAKTMMNDHANIIKQAVDLATKLGVTPKDNAVTQSLLKGEKETLAKLRKLKGADFDRAYMENEVSYHKAVIDAVKTVLIPDAQNAQLKELLVKVMPLLEHHYEMAQKTQSAIK